MLAEVIVAEQQLSDRARVALQKACGLIAPTWPLDQLIAVNPFWEMRDEPFAQVSARLSALAKVHCLMPADHYLKLLEDGAIDPAALKQAAEEEGVELAAEGLSALLKQPLSEPHWHNIGDLLDSRRDPHKMAWCDEIVHQISQFCAAHYQSQRPVLHRGETSHLPNLYRHWLDVSRRDRGISIVMGEPALHRYFLDLPEDSEALLAAAAEELDMADEALTAYAHALLLDINGWASWVAYRRWQAVLHGGQDDDMLDLLAVRMAWELVIWRYLKACAAAEFAVLADQWRLEKRSLPNLFNIHLEQQKPLRVAARAAELSYIRGLNRQLEASSPVAVEQPQLQAVFCIDVRSEVMRRALEQQHPEIQTLGFAGFFGLPIAYTPAGGDSDRPQLPGLLKPTLHVTEELEPNREGGRAGRLNLAARWQSWTQAAPSAFSMVESMGLLYAFKMLKKSFFPAVEENPLTGLSHEPGWRVLDETGESLSVADRAALAKGILGAMGLIRFAPTVLLVGHGSHSANNLHAAGLDCGACGGQTGEVNVRVLAQLLNDGDVRVELAQMGVAIPPETRFVPALHNTTTDHIHCFSGEVPAAVRQWLEKATAAAQAERAGALDESLPLVAAEERDRRIRRRARDWSQVRPEWGLAGNAAFVVAPRSWTRNVDFQGRSFLHDYHWQQDEGFGVLELIMTAPMVVTNWINMQYNASVTDNLKYGSGNKVLHNAVGGNIGVFEGNGGDLRIGLPLQSLHDGKRWLHSPQRLAVYLAAPREPIADIAARHPDVASLIDNDWLYLVRWQKGEVIERFYRGDWVELWRPSTGR